MMEILTREALAKMRPCSKYSGYSGGAASEYFDDAGEITFQQIAVLDIPLEDRIWVLVRMLPMHLCPFFAADCAERVLPIWERWGRLHAPEHLDVLRRTIEAVRMMGSADPKPSVHAADAAFARAASDTCAAYTVSAVCAAKEARNAANAASGAAFAASATTAAAHTAHAVQCAWARIAARSAHNAALDSLQAALYAVSDDFNHPAQSAAYGVTTVEHQEWQIERLMYYIERG